MALYRECVAYNKSLKSRPVEGCYDGEYKQGELLDLSVFPDEIRNEADDSWGEAIDFSVEEMLDMPAMGEVQLDLANNDCIGQNILCKMVVTNNSEAPMTNNDICKMGDYKEPDYMESNSFTSNVRISEPKVSADKEQNPNNSYSAYNESHSGEIPCELFCVTEKDSDYIDIDDLY